MARPSASSARAFRSARASYVRGQSAAQRAYTTAVARQRNPMEGIDYPTRTYPRSGYGSVARARGAAVQGEMKYFDCDRSLTALSACTTTWVAGTIIDPGTTINLGDAAVATPACLFAPKVSAALNGRIGRKCKVFKIKVRGMIVCPVQAAVAAADPPANIRLCLVMDQQTNATQMTSASLFNDGTAANTTLMAFQNPNNFGRFRILKEKIITMQSPSLFNDAATTGAQSGLARAFKMTVVFKDPVLVNFNATNGGTVADIVDNSFHIIVGTDAIGIGPQIAYYSRVAYKE